VTEASAPRRGTDARGRRTLAIIAIVAILPIAASYAIYYLWPRAAQANYGTLLATGPAPAIVGTAPDGAPFRLAELRGKWVLLAGSASGCDAGCEKTLFAMRQARTMQGREQDRVVRVWLAAGGAPPAADLVAMHPGLQVARVAANALDALPGAKPGLWLVDPLGNLVLSYPAEPDPRRLAQDLARVLKASRIG
jgi:cytochrome oxidase Cu insertion factor (SCO1/SenC/PrrC family)